MPASARFRLLKTRLGELRRHLLPAKFSPTGLYSDRALDRARGYRVLVHAEFEAFVEDRCWNLAQNTIQRWKADKRSHHVLMCILARCGPKREADLTIMEYVGQAGNTYYQSVVDKNHGIREQNLVDLLQPIGIERSSLDLTWLSTVDSFGSDRGEVAHRSIGAQKPIDPKTELVLRPHDHVSCVA